MLVKKVLVFFLLILLCILAVSPDDKNDVKAVTSVKDIFKQISFVFGGISGAFGSYNATKAGHIFSTITKKTARFAGFFGAIGALFAIILELIPGGKQESAELKLMKNEFGKLSQKVDTIARSLDNTKDLIKLATQKAAYIKYEENINYGYTQLLQCLKDLEKVTCTSKKECKRKNLLVAERYKTDTNVRKSIDAIFRAAVHDSSFRHNMLYLIKQESRCNITYVNMFTNKIAALITKGLVVAIFHDLLTKPNYDYTDDEVLSSEMIYNLEKKRQEIQKSCFENFDYWIARDMKNAHTLFTSDIKQSNAKLLHHLKSKFPWIIWHAFTYEGKKAPKAGPQISTSDRLISTSKTLEIHSFVIPAAHAEVEEYNEKSKLWKELVKDNNIGKDLENDVTKIDKLINKEIELKDKVQFYAILPGEKLIAGYYKDEIKQYTHEGKVVFESPYNVLVNKPFTNKDVFVAVSFKTVEVRCSDTFCNDKGICSVFPYSTKRECSCKKGFSGENCETREKNMRLKQVVNTLLQSTMKLPTFASIKHAIEDTQLYLKTSTENIQESIFKLGAKMSTFISRKFEWLNIVLKYKDSIDKLHYFHSISSEKIYNFKKNSNVDLSQIKTTTDKGRFSMLEEKDIAQYLLSPVGIQKWLYDINFLIVGRNDSEFNNHRPILFMTMEKYKKQVCLKDYKERLSSQYRQLMLLQLQGYMLWSNAYSAADRDSIVIANRYSSVLKNQESFMQKETCSLAISNSQNLEDCSGGYYIHKSFDIPVSCKGGYFLKGKPYVKNVIFYH